MSGSKAPGPPPSSRSLGSPAPEALLEVQIYVGCTDHPCLAPRAPAPEPQREPALLCGGLTRLLSLGHGH